MAPSRPPDKLLSLATVFPIGSIFFLLLFLKLSVICGSRKEDSNFKTLSSAPVFLMEATCNLFGFICGADNRKPDFSNQRPLPEMRISCKDAVVR